MEKGWGALKPKGLGAAWLWAFRRQILRSRLGRLKHRVDSAASRTWPFMDIEVGGLKMRCHTGDNYTERFVLRDGIRYNAADIRMITSGLMPDDVFIDIGANCGLYTLHAARLVGSGGTVVAIEPSSVMIERLAFNVASNGFSNVKILNVAVGERHGVATLYVDESQRGQSSLIAGTGLKPVKVRMMRLITIVRQLGLKKIDALKIDIEGYEDRAIHPFLLSAPRSAWPRLMLVEVKEPVENDNPCIKHLLEAGYRVMDRAEINTLVGRAV